MEFSTTFYLDTRRSLKNNKNIFPVKLRVYSVNTKKAKLYSTNLNLTIDDFNTITDSSVTVRGKNRENRVYLTEFMQRADKAAKALTTFSFDQFERKLFRSKSASISVSYHYKKKIEELKKNGQVGSASNYDLSLKALGMYLLNQVKFESYKSKSQKVYAAVKSLTFYEINQKWLEGFENFMVKQHKKSYTTVSIYIRCLRTVFNEAISDGDIKRDIYPFGKGKNKYQIPKALKKRKALGRDQLAVLYRGSTNGPEQQKAKDFWFLSYALNGMNMKDILLLKGANLQDDKIVYFRQKTITTKKSNLKQISVFLNEYSKSILQRYGDIQAADDDYIFDVISSGDDPFAQDKKVKNFISHINLFFDRYARSLGFAFKISTYWARHSFATISIQKGASMEFISDALNHSNLTVTKNYFAGFEDETKKEFANSLMDF